MEHLPGNTAADDLSIAAIDILLRPDAVMLAHAEATNQRLLKSFPGGFALDAAHRPHVTLVQRFVLTTNLGQLYDAVGSIIAKANVTSLMLEAFKHYYIPSGDIGLAGIVVRPTADLLALQRQLIDAVTPYAVPTGAADAFVTTPRDTPADLPDLIAYVSAFVPQHAGANYQPHVSTGVASRTCLDAMLAEPFQSFTFSPAGAAVYQLGHFGTAARELKSWDLAEIHG